MSNSITLKEISTEEGKAIESSFKYLNPRTNNIDDYEWEYFVFRYRVNGDKQRIAINREHKLYRGLTIGEAWLSGCNIN